MSDTVFRQPVQTPIESKPIESKNPPVEGNAPVEVPYLDYEKEHGRPYLVDHFKLGDRWNDFDGGFPKEIGIIESYIENKIKTGETANSVKSIEELIKGIEKMTNITKEERAVVRIETISAYIEFLMKADKTKYNLRRYNSY